MRIQSLAPIRAERLPGTRTGGLDRSLLEAFVSPPGGSPPAQRLALPGALAVTTGQQPGLLTGPLYTIYKAVSAAVLARLLEARWQRPVVPVFWVAGDDHDLAEAGSVSWLGPDGSPAQATLRERPADGVMLPMYRELLGGEIEMVLAGLEAAIPSGEHRANVLATLRQHYRPGATVAGSFAATLAEWLAPLGVAVFDPTHTAAKARQAPLLLQALQLAAGIEERLKARHQELVAAGADPGVEVPAGASLVMLEATLGRDRLVRDADRFRCRRSGELLSLDDLSEIGRQDPRRLSANVLLRPVVESALLPTVAYVAGPGERRYLALAEPVYEALDVPRQSVLPRWSGLLVDQKVDRVLEKYGATLSELLAPAQALEARVVRDQLPVEASEALGRLREELQAGYDALARAAVEIDPTIERSIRGLAGQALGGVAEAEKRLISHLRKRQATETGQIARAREILLPGGQPQERVLTIAPWLAREGPGLLEGIALEAEQWYRASLEEPSPGH